jgi:phosphate transport system substrate-binding protein
MGHREKAGPGNRSIRSSMICQTAPLQGRNDKMAMILWVLLIVCSVVASPLQVAAQSPVQISGSTTVNLNVFQPFQAQIETASGVKLKVIANSSSHGLEDLIAGRVDVAMLSSPLTAVAGKINQKQPGAVDTSTLKEFKIGESRVAFVVHPTNPVKSVTLSQLKEILAGNIMNWKEVGGADAIIVVVAEASGGGIRFTVEEKLLGGMAVTQQVRHVTNGPQVPLIVKQLPGAIGCASAHHDLAGVVVLQTEEVITQPLILVTKVNPNGLITKVVEASARVAPQ